jgi:hypothetical protein
MEIKIGLVITLITQILNLLINSCHIADMHVSCVYSDHEIDRNYCHIADKPKGAPHCVTLCVLSDDWIESNSYHIADMHQASPHYVSSCEPSGHQIDRNSWNIADKL